MNRLKKTLLIPIAILAFVVFFSHGVMATANFANLNVSALKYTPYPAEPGKYVQVWIDVMNAATEQADNVIVELMPSYPFYLDAGENSTRFFSKIASFQDLVISYKIRIDANTVEGWNDLKIRLKTDTGSKDFTAKIFVMTSEAVIAVDKVYSEPSEIPPGGTGKVTISLKNTANSVLKDVGVKLDLTASGVPFSPIGSATEKKMYIVNALEEKNVTFDVITDPDADAKPYKIPLTIKYHDEVGTNYTKSDTITLIVGAKPEIISNIESSTILSPGDKGSINVNIVNKGLTKIKFLTVTIGQSYKYQVLSADYVYIGELKSDDYQSAKFDLYVDKGASNVSVPITLAYRDGNNNPYTETGNLSLVLYTPSQLNLMGLRSSNTVSTLLIAAIALIAFYFLYKKFVKK
ncbi:MAG: COG1361 S-layer family protein [Candidatus Aenigmatarchaeota archaeon]